MLVLKLCKHYCPEKILYNMGDCLGDGADGEVFDIEGHPDKVIKFGVLYQRGSTQIEKKYRNIKSVLSELIEAPIPIYGNVYLQDYLGTYSRRVMIDEKWGEQPLLLYYYVMEKLYPLSEDEKKVFWSVVSHNDTGIEKNIPLPKMKEMILEMRTRLDFDAERVTFFCENYKNSRVEHLDIHVRNIMKDLNGNFKLIDFDRSEIRKEQ